jgi:hypothetical protein
LLKKKKNLGSTQIPVADKVSVKKENSKTLMIVAGVALVVGGAIICAVFFGG